MHKSLSQITISEPLNAEPCNYMFILLSTSSLSLTTIISFLFRYWFTFSSDVYKRLGQFDYGQPNCTTHHIKTCIGNEYGDFYEYEWIYIGEVKEGTDDTPHGIGIRVSNIGYITEGYWKDGELHGRGRHIFPGGGYYIGEYKEGRRDGEGVEYGDSGERYEGEWKSDDKYGQGTMYHWNGDKYTGIWVDELGIGEVNYKDGKKYIGEWDCYERNGLGTLYSADGQVLNQGKWEWDEYKGNE